MDSVGKGPLRTTRGVVLRAFVGDFAITIAKYAAAIFSGSAAMFAEAIHTSSDTFNQFLLLIGYNLSGKKDTTKFPFGRGREQFFWSFVVAVLVFGISGVLTFVEGVIKLSTHYVIRDALFSYAVLGISIGLDGYVLYISIRYFYSLKRKEGYDSLRAFLHDFRDPMLLTAIIEDLAAILGVITAIIGISLSILTDNKDYDAISSMIIGAIMMSSGMYLAKKSKDLLIGQGLSRRDQLRIESVIKSNSNVNHVLDIRAIYESPDRVMLAMDVNFVDGLSTLEIENTIDKIESQIRREIPYVRRIYVEAEEKKELG